MRPIDQETLERWVDLDCDEALDGEEKRRVVARLTDLESDARVVAARHSNERLHLLFAESRVPVQEGFTERVMESLPQLVWARSSSRSSMGLASMMLPVALVACFAVAAVVLTSRGFGSAEPHAFGIMVAVLDFLQASILAGAGLLFVSWRGIGIGLEELLGGAGLSLFAFASTVVFLNLLLFSLLRRRSRRHARERNRK